MATRWSDRLAMFVALESCVLLLMLDAADVLPARIAMSAGAVMAAALATACWLPWFATDQRRVAIVVGVSTLLSTVALWRWGADRATNGSLMVVAVVLLACEGRRPRETKQSAASVGEAPGRAIGATGDGR